MLKDIVYNRTILYDNGNDNADADADFYAVQWMLRRLWVVSAAALGAAVLQVMPVSVTCRPTWTSKSHRSSPTATTIRRRCRIICRSFRSATTAWWILQWLEVSWRLYSVVVAMIWHNALRWVLAPDRPQPTAARLHKGAISPHYIRPCVNVKILTETEQLVIRGME